MVRVAVLHGVVNGLLHAIHVRVAMPIPAWQRAAVVVMID